MPADVCPACHRGLMVPFEIDDWAGPQTCSFCGRTTAGSRVCITPDDPYGVTASGDDSELGAARQRKAEIQTSAPVQAPPRKYVIGGTCRQGHKLTKANLKLHRRAGGAVSATCEECRREKRRAA